MTGADLRFTGVSKTYGSTVALSGVDAFIAQGESVAVMGPSGSGKDDARPGRCGGDRPRRR